MANFEQINVRPEDKERFTKAAEAYCKKMGLPEGSLKLVDAFAVMVEQWENFQQIQEAKNE